MVTALSGWGGRWGRKNTCGCQDSELRNFLGWNVMEGKKELPRIYGHSVETVLSAFSEKPCWKGLCDLLGGSSSAGRFSACLPGGQIATQFLLGKDCKLAGVCDGHSLFSGIKH